MEAYRVSLLFAIDTPFFDANGAPLAFGTVYFGLPNQDAVTNPKSPYTSSTYLTPLSATQTLTIGGKFAQEVWLNGDYSIVIKDANGVQVAEYPLVPEPDGGAAWGGITGTLSAQTDLQTALNAKMPLLTYTGHALKPLRVNSAESAIEVGTPRVITEELTANRILDAADLGKHFYTLAATATNITVTVPAALGDGFHCSFFHEGSGTFTIAGGVGVTVKVPVGGALTLPTGGYGSICVFGSDALIKLFGQTDTAP